jgi:gas vesicle protein
MNSEDWKSRTMLFGGLLGALAGVLAALLYIRSAESSGTAQRGRPRIAPRSAIDVGVGLMNVLGQIADLAED